MCEAECLSWLTLSGPPHARMVAPLLRPVVHGFVRGISGAVVSFPADRDTPRLWLAAEDEIEAAQGGEEKCAHLSVTTCTTCGPTLLVSLLLEDFEFTRREPGGGEAAGDSHYWEPLEESLEGAALSCLTG